MNYKFYLKLALAGTMFFQSTTSWAKAQKNPALEDSLPNLLAFSKPLSETQFEFSLEPILINLRTECSRPAPAHITPDQQEACILEDSWNHLQSLLNALNDPDKSPLHFSERITNSKLEQVAAGAWRKNLMANPPLGQPAQATQFSAEIMLTKIIIQKALLAYSRWSTYISRDSDNNATNYIVPKLIQSLEGRSLLGGLITRFKNHKCSNIQNTPKPADNLCQIEKIRLGSVIHKLYKSSEDDLLSALKMTSKIIQESNTLSSQQLAFLEPLHETLNKIMHSTEPANKMWADLKSENYEQRDLIEEKITDLTTIPISFKNEELVNTHIALSALLTIKTISDILSDLEHSQANAMEVFPGISNKPEMEELNRISRKEISVMTSVIQDFLILSSEGDF